MIYTSGIVGWIDFKLFLHFTFIVDYYLSRGEAVSYSLQSQQKIIMEISFPDFRLKHILASWQT